MRIEVRGLRTEVTDELDQQVRKGFGRVGRQVDELATLDVVLSEEKNPAIAASQVADATLRTKGVTFVARESAPDMTAAIKAISTDIGRQVTRHREKQRGRAGSRRFWSRLRRESA